MHQRLIRRPATTSLYNSLIQVINRQLQRLPRIVELLIQVREEGQAMAALVAGHPVGIDSYAEDLAENSIGIVLI